MNLENKHADDYIPSHKKSLKKNLKTVALSSSTTGMSSKEIPFRGGAAKRLKRIIIEMETRGSIHLNKKFIKNIYLYGTIKLEIEIFQGE